MVRSLLHPSQDCDPPVRLRRSSTRPGSVSSQFRHEREGHGRSEVYRESEQRRRAKDRAQKRDTREESMREEADSFGGKESSILRVEGDWFRRICGETGGSSR